MLLKVVGEFIIICIVLSVKLKVFLSLLFCVWIIVECFKLLSFIIFFVSVILCILLFDLRIVNIGESFFFVSGFFLLIFLYFISKMLVFKGILKFVSFVMWCVFLFII